MSIMIEKLMNAGLKTICNPAIQKLLNKVFKINPNDLELGFKKVNGEWYSDIKNWPKAYEERQLMVAGADKLLEYLSEGKDYITLHVKQENFPGATHLHKIKEDLYGGTYLVNREDIDYTVWLCNVTKFVYGKHPDNIYFEVVR